MWGGGDEGTMKRGFVYGALIGFALAAAFFLAYTYRLPFEDVLACLCLPAFILPGLAQDLVHPRGIASLLLGFIGNTATYGLLGMGLGWLIRARRWKPGHCDTCGYDLTGNVTGTCPECGEDTPNYMRTSPDASSGFAATDDDSDGQSVGS